MMGVLKKLILFVCFVVGLLVFTKPTLAQDVETQSGIETPNHDDRYKRPEKKEALVRRGVLMIREDEAFSIDQTEKKSRDERLIELEKKYIEAKTAGDAKQAAIAASEMSGLGHSGAQETLALMFLNGDGIEQSYVKALYWLRRSAAAGQPVSMHYLGSLYLNGQGVEPNPVNAYMWFKLAADLYPDDRRVQAVDDYQNVQKRLNAESIKRADEKRAAWLEENPNIAKFVRAKEKQQNAAKEKEIESRDKLEEAKRRARIK